MRRFARSIIIIIIIIHIKGDHSKYVPGSK